MVWEFVIFGVLCTTGVWILQYRRFNAPTRITLSLIVFIFSSLYLYLIADEVFLADQVWYERSPYRELLFFIVMLLGMAARYVSKAIESRSERIEALKKSGAAFEKPPIEWDVWEFSYPLFFSVVTFGALLTQLGEQAVNTPGLILSFETGFFWQTILARKLKE